MNWAFALEENWPLQFPGTLDENDAPRSRCRFCLRFRISADTFFMGAGTRNLVAQRDPEHVQAGDVQLRLCEARCHDPDA